MVSWYVKQKQENSAYAYEYDGEVGLKQKHIVSI